ncbi:Antibiotic biosynthesis monooxygenase [Vibrio atlanticus]|uniref:Antibiotic biosynthesis monooxygenase n=2 Tax=Vibrio TaxID=662 RepID=B7VRM1_VIBA3|nr:Antibiotic biosynthesis monooxygenase [Vibrio atlanticus]
MDAKHHSYWIPELFLQPEFILILRELIEFKAEELKMSKLTIIATIVSKEDKTELVKSEMIKLIDRTRVEDGCINYDLHQDNSNPAHFVFHENWESEAHLEKHLASQHIAEYMAATEDCIETFVLNKMTHIA